MGHPLIDRVPICLEKVGWGTRLPIDDAMLEIQVLVGDAHSVYVRVGDTLPVGDQVEFKLL